MQYYDKTSVGKRIIDARKQKNMTQADLSDALEYSGTRQLQRIEAGENGCSIDKLMEIAQILDVSTDYLLFGDVKKEDEDKDKEMVVRLLSKRNPAEKEYAYQLLRTVFDNLELLT